MVISPTIPAGNLAAAANRSLSVHSFVWEFIPPPGSLTPPVLSVFINRSNVGVGLLRIQPITPGEQLLQPGHRVGGFCRSPLGKLHRPPNHFGLGNLPADRQTLQPARRRFIQSEGGAARHRSHTTISHHRCRQVKTHRSHRSHRSPPSLMITTRPRLPTGATCVWWFTCRCTPLPRGCCCSCSPAWPACAPPCLATACAPTPC